MIIDIINGLIAIAGYELCKCLVRKWDWWRLSKQSAAWAAEYRAMTPQQKEELHS